MTKLIAGNWKMFKGPVETLAFFDGFEAPDGVDVVLCPPFVSLEAAVGEEWPIYAQNVHWADEGAFTGEISARMLVELGVQGTLVGHSERRLYFGETDETVRLRAEAALAAGLGVIACVGETEAEREAGETEAVLRRQVAVLPAPRGARDRLRARLGDRHRQDRDTRAGAGGARADQVAPRHAGALRRLGQARERRRAPRPAGRRRRARRRRLARRRLLLEPVPDRSFPLVTLVILDGWGLAPAGPGNAVELASTPVFDGLWAAFPHTSLAASGEAVGLPDGQMGNSEVGHLTIGSGRVLFQDLMRVNVAVRDGSIFENAALCAAFARAKERGGDVHLLGLVSQGGVHSHIDHLLALLELARREGMADRTWIHAFTDGRDVSPHAAAVDLARLPADRIATVVGRYYAMDRDNRAERTERAVAAILDGEGEHGADPGRRRGRELRARHDRRVRRADRLRAPVRASTPPPTPRSSSTSGPTAAASCHARLLERGVDLTTMTRYAEDIATPVAFPEQHVGETLAETLSGAGIRQLHAAETEKYAHVTYFFNGGEEAEWEGETRVLVPSPRDVASYDLKPEMSAAGVADEVVSALPDGYGFCVVNFANPDMVGHTGVIPAVVRAVEAADAALGRVVEATHRARWRLPRHRGSRQRRADARGRRRQPSHGAHDEPRAARPHRCRCPVCATAAPSPTSHRPSSSCSEQAVPAAMTGRSLVVSQDNENR